MRILISGGCGFVGSALVRRAVRQGMNVFNIDQRNTHQGHPALQGCHGEHNYSQLIGDVSDPLMMSGLIREFSPDAIIHCAGGIQWKRGIPTGNGLTATMGFLEAIRLYANGINEEKRRNLKLIIPFDANIFGSLADNDPGFKARTSLRPQTTEAGRAATDMALIQGWSNETRIEPIFAGASALYGFWQAESGFLPTLLKQFIKDENYIIQRGEDSYDWLHIDDFAYGIMLAAIRGQRDETYLFSSNAERRKIDIATNVATILDGIHPRKDGKTHSSLVQSDTFHNPPTRCVINSFLAEKALDWSPSHPLLLSLRDSVIALAKENIPNFSPQIYSQLHTEKAAE